MSKILSLLLFTSLFLYSSDSKYRLEKGEASPEEAPATVRAALPSPGMKIVTASGESYLEFWFVEKALPASSKEESGATLTGVQHGAFIGLVRVGKNVNDRRGDRIRPGLYALRLSFHPVDGAHQGVATQRDFLVLTPAATDGDPTATPAFADLMKLAKVASGANHPLSLSCWKQDQDFSPGLGSAGENDTVLQVRIGGTAVVIIIAGRYEG